VDLGTVMPADTTPTRGSKPAKTFRVTTRTKTKSQQIDAPATSATSNAASVQDRIRQWQAQGAADALAPDAVSVRSNPLSDCGSNVSRPISEHGSEYKIRVGRKTRARDKSTPIDAERSQSTPRKRVISDSHWKNSQSEAKNKNTRPALQERSASRRYDPTYTSNQPEKSPRKSSRQKNERSAARDAEVWGTAFDGGIRVTPLSRENSACDGEEPPSYDAHSYVDDDLAKNFDGQPIFSHDSMPSSDLGSLQEPDDLDQHKPSLYAQTLGKAHGSPPKAELIKGRRGKLLGKTKDIFMKSENVPTVSNRVPSIEAWLHEQSDPFVDNGAADDLPPVEIPQPLRRRTRRQRSLAEPTVVADPNHIWDSLSPRSVTQAADGRAESDDMQTPSHVQTPKSRNRPSTRDEHEDPDNSPTGLRRRGARVRRQRGLSRAETQEVGVSTDVCTVLGGANATQPLQSNPPEISASLCPRTGAHQLSPITPIKILQQIAPIPPLKDAAIPKKPALERKLTTHDDLMSVLSMPRRSRNRRSTRRGLGSRSKHATESVKDILASLALDEQKYGQELRTLVDGVVPVLLQCVLSKSDSAAVAGLFTSTGVSDGGGSITKPMIDMGVALERLKTMHSRIPLEDIDALLLWAKSSEKAYRDYLQAWRLGFQDILINLAPLDDSASVNATRPRNEAGDIVDEQGKTADVAYLLKRPLVRVKALSKVFCLVKEKIPGQLALETSQLYDDLTVLAKKRNLEEQARLEDEAAAAVDTTRARDVRTLAAVVNVKVDKTRRVKARDFFNLTVYHSSGQRLDCGIELVFRDSVRNDAAGGDVLFCEVDNSGKWLLFAPVELDRISARRGEETFDLVLMIRGRAGLGQEWHELLALKTDDKEAVTEWMSMIGSNPLPPRLNRTPDIVPPPAPLATRAPELAQASKSDVSTRIPEKCIKPDQVELPIGEPSVLGARSDTSRHSAPARATPGLSLGGGLAPRSVPQYPTSTRVIPRRPVSSVVSSDRTTLSTHSTNDTATIITTSSSKTTSTGTGHVFKQKQLFEQSTQARHPPPLQTRAPVEASSHNDGCVGPSVAKGNVGTDARKHEPNQPFEHQPRLHQPQTSPQAVASRPQYSRALSSAPSRELPTVNKIRIQQPDAVSSQGQSPFPPPQSPESRTSDAHSREDSRSIDRLRIYTEDVPVPPTHSPRDGRPTVNVSSSSDTPPATPPHRAGVLQLTSSNKALIQRPTPSPPDKTVRKRGSSPLKHEYAPSSSSSASLDLDSDDESDLSSETSDDLEAERGDVSTPLVAVDTCERKTSRPSVLPSMPPSSYHSTGTRTLAPSDSASQGPYRSVPASTSVHPQKKLKTIALICAWSDKGMWEQIYPDECSIIITPGLIEAYEMSAFHSNSQVGAQALDDGETATTSSRSRPLVAFELTPIVPLRRGTALDISIRSPPTQSSKIRTTNNVMFRSRNPEECESLYGMINWARCHNPTYIQLQNARPAQQPSVSFNVGQPQQSKGRASSWFSFGSQKKSSYRASSAPTPASVDMSVESSRTMASAFSVLKRLGVSNAFNVNRSSVHRKTGQSVMGDSLYSSSSGTRTGSGSVSSTPMPSQMGIIPGKDGPNVPVTSAAAVQGGGMINNMKIRLYVRKGQHWENLGAARLTVMPPQGVNSGANTPRRTSGVSPPSTPSQAPQIIGQPGQQRGPRLPSSSHTPHRVHGNGREKRILITHSKKADVILLDSVLGESCFERVMQTGIAVKVWSEDETVGDRGGVTLGRETVYMMQFPGAREAGWVFGLCGVYRYGVGGEQ
jgi:hypothetical protein